MVIYDGLYYDFIVLNLFFIGVDVEKDVFCVFASTFAFVFVVVFVRS